MVSVSNGGHHNYYSPMHSRVRYEASLRHQNSFNSIEASSKGRPPSQKGRYHGPRHNRGFSIDNALPLSMYSSKHHHEESPDRENPFNRRDQQAMVLNSEQHSRGDQNALASRHEVISRNEGLSSSGSRPYTDVAPKNRAKARLGQHKSIFDKFKN